jgi:hypothetical protein
MASKTYTNTARGSRGIRTKDGNLVMIEPGQSVDLEDVDPAEAKDAELHGIESGKAAAKEAAKDDGAKA